MDINKSDLELSPSLLKKIEVKLEYILHITVMLIYICLYILIIYDAGTIPSEVRSLSKLEEVTLSHNNISGMYI